MLAYSPVDKDMPSPLILFRFLIHRPILCAALGVGIAVGMGLHFTMQWRSATVLLASWNTGVGCYLALWAWRFWSAQDEDIQVVAKRLDEGKWLMMLLVIAAISMCLTSIVSELGQLNRHSPYLLPRMALSVLTLVSSWLLMHTTFAIHYAHDFYNCVAQGKDGGLNFPNTQQPTYPDFIYFSYIIGSAAQTADISLTTTSTRVLNTVHCMVAFGFNTSILAIMINVVANLFIGNS